MNQASEARQLLRTPKHNPEVQSIATRCTRISISACRKCAERCQVCRFPQRDTVAERVRNQYAFTVECDAERDTQSIACERCQHECACQGVSLRIFNAY